MQGKVQRYGRNGTVGGAILAIPLLILGACGGPSGQGGPGGPPEQVIPVEVQPVVRTNIEEAVELIGTVRSRNRVQLASEIPGTVLKYERLDGETFQMGTCWFGWMTGISPFGWTRRKPIWPRRNSN
jgi:hypothetical protein